MPISDGKYVSPTWVNGTSPALDASEMQAITDTLAAVPVKNGGTGATSAAGARTSLGVQTISVSAQTASLSSNVLKLDTVSTNLSDGAALYLSQIASGATLINVYISTSSRLAEDNLCIAGIQQVGTSGTYYLYFNRNVVISNETVVANIVYAV